MIQHDLVALTAAPVAMLVMSGLLVWLAILWAEEMAGLLVASILVPLDFWIAYRIDSRRAALVAAAEEADRLLREEFGDRDGWLVDLCLHRNGATIGRDRGMLWTEGERLMFAGGRMSFSLAPSQAFGARRVRAIPGLRHGLALDLSDGLGLTFAPQTGDADPVESLLLARVRGWSLGKGSGGQMPPATLGPGAPSPARLLGAALVSTAFWIYLAAVAALVLQYGGSPVLIAVAALVGFPLHAWYPWARWRALQARLRLEREAGNG